MRKMRKLLCFFLAALCLAALSAPARALDDPQTDSSYAVVLVAERGSSESVLYTKNARDLVYPASLTKIMTVLLAVEDIEAGAAHLTDMVTAQPGFDFDMIPGGSSVYTATGETMSLESLLYCAMVASANESCNIIAQHISGSVSDFVARMNQRAAELGCTDTHFTNTHGLPDANHYTTAWDFSRILREAATHELFMEISNTVTYTVPDTNLASERKLENTNSLINPTNPLYPGPYGYDYAKGVKTGHTSDAGYCLASTAEKDGVTLLSIVMNSKAYELDDGSWYYGHFADTRTLFEWAFENFSYQEIVRSTEIVAEVPVEMGADTDAVAVRPSTSIVSLLPNDVDLSAFTRTVVLYPEQKGEALTAPVSAGQVVGEITVSLNGETYGSSPLVTSTSVDLSRVRYMRGQLAETLRQPVVVITFWALVLLFLAYLALVIRYRAKRRAYQKRLEDARRVRLDLEDEEEELMYARRVRATAAAAPGTPELVMEPESSRPAPEREPVDEPTRFSGRLPELREEDAPTRAEPLDLESDAPRKAGPPPEEGPRDYFEEFFGKK